jgi:hypothetical protein
MLCEESFLKDANKNGIDCILFSQITATQIDSEVLMNIFIKGDITLNDYPYKYPNSFL